jgi:hypothetical protein
MFSGLMFNSCSEILPDITLPSWTFNYDFWINPEDVGNKMAKTELIEADIKGFLEENGVDFDPTKVASVKIESLNFKILNTEDPVNNDIDFSWLQDIQSALEIKGLQPQGPENVATFPGQGPEEKEMSLAVNNELDLKDYFLKESGDTLYANASGTLAKDLESRVQIQAELKVKVTLD